MTCAVPKYQYPYQSHNQVISLSLIQGDTRAKLPGFNDWSYLLFEEQQKSTTFALR